MDLRSYLQMGHLKTLRFFYAELRKINPAKELHTDEALHVAAILAHYAQTSCYQEKLADNPGVLAQWSTNSIFHQKDAAEYRDLMLMAARQALFLGGFLRDQRELRREMYWFDALGRKFYRKAVVSAAGPRQETLFTNMALNFHTWAIICRDLNRKFQDNRTIFWPHKQKLIH